MTNPNRLPRGQNHPAWAGDQPSYTRAHQRMTNDRGPASKHPCAMGCGRQAADWAYDHKDPNELTGRHRGRFLTYSADPDHYLPLCGICHQRLDRAVALSRGVEVGYDRNRKELIGRSGEWLVVLDGAKSSTARALASEIRLSRRGWHAHMWEAFATKNSDGTHKVIARHIGVIDPSIAGSTTTGDSDGR